MNHCWLVLCVQKRFGADASSLINAWRCISLSLLGNLTAPLFQTSRGSQMTINSHFLGARPCPALPSDPLQRKLHKDVLLVPPGVPGIDAIMKTSDNKLLLVQTSSEPFPQGCTAPSHLHNKIPSQCFIDGMASELTALEYFYRAAFQFWRISTGHRTQHNQRREGAEAAAGRLLLALPDLQTPSRRGLSSIDTLAHR